MEERIKNKIGIFFSLFNKTINYLSLGIVILIFLVIGFGMFGGTIGLLNTDFIKYLINTSFILAGFTFLAFLSEDKDKFKERLISPCWLFILSGFLLLAFTTIPNIIGKNRIFEFLQAYNIAIGVFGLLFFSWGLVYLIIVIFLEQNRIHETVNKKRIEKDEEIIQTLKNEKNKTEIKSVK